jgi:very-short-patch-repair endonuclease
LQSQLDGWLQDVPKLYQLVRFNQLKREMKPMGLADVIEKASHWANSSEDLVHAFDLTWYSGLVEKGYADAPSLLTFDHVKQTHLLERFRRLDQSSLGHAQAHLAKTIWEKKPGINQPGEMAVLRNELNKKRRLMPIRQLIDQAGRAIQHIKPVFMMSPMSIANFLPPGKLEFDVVIFDEASQVKAVDAFGAVLRGRQVIVVGDTRQMPPSDFFGREVEIDDEDNVTSDIESVLAMFRARGAQERYLSWHYRSRHESLIAVSNVEFYDRKLVIFPSPGTNRLATGLKLRHLPEALYDRGRTRTNRGEAKALAQAVLAHAIDNPGMSLGVVAFSMAQRDLIQVEVELMRRGNPDAEPFFNGAHPTEPFFIKNLENVQGDERDAIFISIGYGRNESGRIAKEFGPVNRDGGERRLNVLISRAKMSMEVFCNFRADELELDANASHGVRALKHFLSYAETRELDIPLETGKEADSPFETEVMLALQERGYGVEAQVGTAGYFIDMAVKDPEFPGRYVLAIECDGASYHSSRSARDRDRLRQGVLESLGWRFHRIWSTDWFRNPGQELERTAAAIEEARQAAKLNKPVDITIKPVSAPIILRDVVADSDMATAAMAYRKAKIPTMVSAGYALHEAPTDRLSMLVKSVVTVESPVHEAEVTKRLMESFGVSRAGNRIVENISVALNHGHRAGLFHFSGGFVYADKTCTAVVRNRGELEAAERKIEWVSPEELDTALLEVVRMGFSISQEAAVSGALESLGFGRVTANISSVMNTRVDRLLKTKKMTRQDEKLVIT